MIAKVVRGWNPAGLLVYLFGPGRFEEHRDPRVVASWDGAPWLHQPERLPDVVLDGEVLPAGEFDLDLKPLMRSMRQVAEWAGLSTGRPRRLPDEWAARLRRGEGLPLDAQGWARQYRMDRRTGQVELQRGLVWHCSVRLHPDDPVLDDRQWEKVAHRLMRATGIDQAGCRWIAVRHADDHIHLMAVLVSEQTGQRYEPFRDFLKLRDECRSIERDLGLVETAPADRTAAPAPTRAERAKAARLGRERTPREELRRLVSQCAAAAHDGASFLAGLTREGLDPRAVRDIDGRVCGYTVARPGDFTAAGTPVRYAGRALAPDLTWPRLQTRWSGTSPGATASRRDVLRQTTAVVERAVRELRTAREETDGVAHAVGEVLTVVGRGWEGRTGGPLCDAADRFDRAARTPHVVVRPNVGGIATDLRMAARRLSAVGALWGRGRERFALAALVVALAAVVAEIAAWQQQRGRSHQAAAARAWVGALPRPAAAGSSAPARAGREEQPPITAVPRVVRPAVPPRQGGRGR